MIDSTPKSETFKQVEELLHQYHEELKKEQSLGELLNLQNEFRILACNLQAARMKVTDKIEKLK